MKPKLCIVFLFFNIFIFAQQEESKIISLQANQEQEILIPAYKGDAITLNASLYQTKKGKISSLAFYAYPNNLLSKIEDVKSYSNTIHIKKGGVYRLVLKSNNKKPIEYQINYSITTTRKKRPRIGYKVLKDTTYGYETTQFRSVERFKTKTVQNEKFYLNSTSNALFKGGKNRIVFPVNLPRGTKEWYYVFTASRNEADIKNTLSTFNLASQLTKYIDEDSSLQKSVTSLSPPPGAHICDIYTIENETNAKLFKEKEDFEYTLDGSRENYKSGIVTVKGQTKSYLGIRNPDNVYGIHVGIEIIAVVGKAEKIKETIHIPIITSSQVPYLME